MARSSNPDLFQGVILSGLGRCIVCLVLVLTVASCCHGEVDCVLDRAESLIADAKIPQAQYLMGLLYLLNDLHIVDENPSLALRYLKAARDGGCSLAEAKIKKLENEQKEGTERKEKRKQQDEELATNLTAEIQKAENGELDTEAVLHLASVLAIGDDMAGIKRNANKATKLYRIAAKQGKTEAMFILGVRMIDGEGCRKNWNAGMEYIRKAAKAGHLGAIKYVENHDTFINRMIHKIIK